MRLKKSPTILIDQMKESLPLNSGWNRRQKKITAEDDRVIALSEELIGLAKEVGQMKSNYIA